MLSPPHDYVFTVIYTVIQISVPSLHKIFHPRPHHPLPTQPTPAARLCSWLYTASPAAAGGGPASSANLLEQKLELDISLLRKHNRPLSLQGKGLLSEDTACREEIMTHL